MMSRLRLVIAWLVMAAVPLQGLAAATMAFCGGTHDAQIQQVVQAMDTDGAAHDHSKHSHAAKAETKGGGGKDLTKAMSLPDASHKCGVCASCCHSIALTEFPHWPAFAPLPQAELAEPIMLIHAIPSELPDKPPRA